MAVGFFGLLLVGYIRPNWENVLEIVDLEIPVAKGLFLENLDHFGIIPVIEGQNFGRKLQVYFAK